MAQEEVEGTIGVEAGEHLSVLVPNMKFILHVNAVHVSMFHAAWHNDTLASSLGSAAFLFPQQQFAADRKDTTSHTTMIYRGRSQFLWPNRMRPGRAKISFMGGSDPHEALVIL